MIQEENEKSTVVINNKFNFKGKWQAIKEMFLELSQEVYCECFPKIFEESSHIVNKLIWTFLFVIFTALTCYFLTQNVLGYFRQVIF